MNLNRSFVIAVMFVAVLPLPAEMTVALQTSSPSPAPFGTIVTWIPEVSGDSPGTLWYRFRYRGTTGDFQLIRDYGPNSVLNWTNTDADGRYEVEVSVWNRDTGEQADSITIFDLTPTADSQAPAVTKTEHPLVVIYSAPPCPPGNRIRVAFRTTAGPPAYTGYKTCAAGVTVNFQLGGLRGSTSYSARHEISPTATEASAVTLGPPVLFTTDPLPKPGLSYQISPVPPATDAVLLQSPLYTPAVATDLEGNLVWYYYGETQTLTRAGNSGTFLALSQVAGGDPSRQTLRKFDLRGMTLLETNAAAVNQQLNALALRPITAFHHEVRELPDGKILALASAEQILTGIQGDGEVDVLGDVILVFDRDLRVVWAWDSFEHLDVGRPATLGETCTPGGGGCPPFYLAPIANDWLHGNAVDLLPDGNLLYSARHQDWLIKIDYRNGEGNGDVLWRLGKDGDFTMDSEEPNPWFSHQHDGKHASPDGSRILLFDNGNLRMQDDPAANSRGQLLQLDEAQHTARLLLNADLGSYSPALGSAQLLANGNFHFLSGFIGGVKSESVEVDPSGNVIYRIEAPAVEYRSIRMQNLYTSPD